MDYHSTYNDTTDFSSVITKLYEDIKSTVVVKSSTTDLDDPNQISIDFRGNCLSMQNSVSWIVVFSRFKVKNLLDSVLKIEMFNGNFYIS